MTSSLALLAESTTAVDFGRRCCGAELYRSAKYDLVDEATLDREEEARRKQR